MYTVIGMESTCSSSSRNTSSESWCEDRIGGLRRHSMPLLHSTSSSFPQYMPEEGCIRVYRRLRKELSCSSWAQWIRRARTQLPASHRLIPKQPLLDQKKKSLTACSSVVLGWLELSVQVTQPLHTAASRKMLHCCCHDVFGRRGGRAKLVYGFSKGEAMMVGSYECLYKLQR